MPWMNLTALFRYREAITRLKAIVIEVNTFQSSRSNCFELLQSEPFLTVPSPVLGVGAAREHMFSLEAEQAQD